MNRLYKVYGQGHEYNICEYACPKNLNYKFDIEIPDEIISNISINDGDQLCELYETGLIDQLIYEDIISGHWKQTFFFLAKQVGPEKYICTRLKQDSNRIKGHIPTAFDKYKYKLAMCIYIVIYIIFAFYATGLVMNLLGSPYGK